MNKDEILKAAENDTPKIGDAEVYFQRKGAVIALFSGLVICVIMYVTEYFILHKMDYGKLSIITAMLGISDLYEGIKNKSKKTIIFGSIGIIVTVVLLILYIKGAYFG